MGCVFLAEDLSLQRPVVLKWFWQVVTEDVRHVFKEALAMKQIAREYVPEPLTVELYQHYAYLITEYIENALDGEAWLQQHGALTEPQAMSVATQIAKGLQAAHSQGVLHLDLKPANVLLQAVGEGIVVKIIDFGLAHIAQPLQGQARRTQRQTTQFGRRLAGTWDYAPPEQRGRVEYGELSVKSDVYAFGKTLLRLCSNREPQNCRERDISPSLREVLFDFYSAGYKPSS